MSPNIPLEELGSTPGEKRLLRRVGLVATAIVLGAVLGVGAYAWAGTQIGTMNNRITAVDAAVAQHLNEMRILRPQMDAYVREEREARCSMALNVYKLCRRTSTDCLPVSASCTMREDR